MQNDLFAGLDVSTQSTKLVIIDTEKTEIKHLSTVNYDKDLPQFQTENGTRKDSTIGVSESDPNMWIAAIEKLFDRLYEGKPEAFPSIKAISVSGQQHGLVTLTEKGELSRPYSKLWNDFSTSEECEIITEKVGGGSKMIELIGNTQRTGYTAPKILHMIRNEAENYRRTSVVLLVHNFINWWLTGGKNGGVPVMEPGDVSGSALWDPVKRQWSKEIINAIDPGLEKKLPPVKESREPIGKIGKHLIEKYNFSKNCLIASGSGDNMMGAIGTGNYKPGIVTVSLGTSGTAYTVMKEPYVDPEGEIALFCDALGNYLPLLCISNLANGYEAVLREYDISHGDFEKIVVEKTPPGNKGRLIIPWFEGERTPDLPEAAPVYFGFSLSDYTKETVCRAVLEGHVMNLYEGYVKLPVKPTRIFLTGGISKSRVWRETIANIFNCEVVPVEGEGAALGAALHAAWVFYRDKTIAEIVDPFKKIDESLKIEPDPEIVPIYESFKRLYTAVSRRIRGISGEDPFKLFKILSD